MAQSTFERVWNRLVDRYDPESSDDCCDVGLETTDEETKDASTDSCCE